MKNSFSLTWQKAFEQQLARDIVNLLGCFQNVNSPGETDAETADIGGFSQTSKSTGLQQPDQRAFAVGNKSGTETAIPGERVPGFFADEKAPYDFVRLGLSARDLVEKSGERLPKRARTKLSVEISNPSVHGQIQNDFSPSEPGAQTNVVSAATFLSSRSGNGRGRQFTPEERESIAEQALRED